jgi:hypothetical protein
MTSIVQSSNHRFTASGLNRTRRPVLRKGRPWFRRLLTCRVLQRAYSATSRTVQRTGAFWVEELKAAGVSEGFGVAFIAMISVSTSGCMSSPLASTQSTLLRNEHCCTSGHPHHSLKRVEIRVMTSCDNQLSKSFHDEHDAKNQGENDGQ